MAIQAQYRFLPWTRRGLVAEVQQADNGGALPGRAKISVGVTVTNAGPNAVDLALYGPGDVLGIDTRLIVRMSPRSGSTNVEPNYFAAIEFDPPDFPWMFSPAKANPDQRLRPWLVLLVLDRANVALPKVDRTQPLPTITIPGDVAAQELPDLSESWAWAHTQVMTEDTLPNNQLPGELKDNPDLNVSRLVCPRRLVPNHQYIACLVPAFSAGVARGLGGTPDPKAQLAPAWTASPGEVKLPIYYHWEFATGPLGDFESLARKLKPFASPETVGTIPMYIGDGNLLIPEIAPDQEAANTLMDGALRAPARASGKLSEIDTRIQDGLKTALNLPSVQYETGPQDATPILGPPIYGQWHAKQHTIKPSNPTWMRELNLDPRSRVAAGLGAEVVRKFQEDFMQKAWEQIGEVIKANTWLNWGRLSLEANQRLYVRHFASLPDDRLLQMTAALHSRTLQVSTTIRTMVRFSSLPGAVSDSAMRRLSSPQHSMMKSVVRRLTAENRLAPAFSKLGRSTLTRSLSAGKLAVDPTRFTPDGLVTSITLDEVRLGTGPTIDLKEAGLDVQLDAARVRTYRKEVRSIRDIDFLAAPPQISVRADLRSTGLITNAHIANLAAMDLMWANDKLAATNTYSMIDLMLKTAIENPGAKGILITLDSVRRPILNPLEIGRDGTIVARLSPTSTRVVGKLDKWILNFGLEAVTGILAELPPGTLLHRGAVRPEISMGVSGEVLLRKSKFSKEHAPEGTVFNPTGGRLVIPIKPGTKNKPLVERKLFESPLSVTQPPLLIIRAVAGALLETAPVVAQPTVGAQPPVMQPPVTKPPTTKPPVITQPPVIRPPAPTNTIPMPLPNVEAITIFESVLNAIVLSTELNRPYEGGKLQAFDLRGAAKTLVERIDPVVMIPKRMVEMIKIGGLRLDQVAGLGVEVAPTYDRILIAPEFHAAAYKYLALYDQERFVPGIGVIPPNSITLLETNPRFIEGFMVGLNYEMNREYLWRALPTDQRATSWSFFWEWMDGIPDIPPIHTWRTNTLLGSNTRGAGAGGQLVLLVRGELVRRYPNAVLLAWKATPDGSALTDIPPGATPAQRDLVIKRPVFQGKLDPDIIFGGFDLVDSDLNKDGGWFFIVQEQPTEPRFGFDQPDGPPGTLTKWSDASWAHTGVAEGGHILLQTNPLNGRTFTGLTFGSNAAHIAAITLQKPMRVAVHGRYLVK